MRRRSGRIGAALIACAACGLLVTCAGGSELKGKLEGVDDIITQAEANGAYTCAPVQLAMAKSHAKFAALEMSEGFLSKAKKHYALAETNANEAYKLSPPEKCAPKQIKVEVPDIPIVPKVGDRDGDGYKDDVDQCPDSPEDFDAVIDEDGCPEDEDSDGDGRKDWNRYCWKPAEGLCDDVCPLEPEDPDGYQDDDGCPDPDNDEDKILDVDDQCPNVKGVPEEKGCPAKPKIEGVIITEKKVEILETIYFEYNKALIKPESFGILDKVVQVLQMFPELKLEVQGHTDDKGNDFYNMCLSAARAESVKNYLIAHGIEGWRLSSVGYGETCPIDSNMTDEGRARNRRVEFIRTDVDEIERACPVPVQPILVGKGKGKKCKKFKTYSPY